MHTPPTRTQTSEPSDVPQLRVAQDTAGQPGLTRTPPPTPPRCVPSHELLGTHKTLAIAHEGVVYHLRTTRLGKLILTK